jgi:hypothetical protein
MNRDDGRCPKVRNLELASECRGIRAILLVVLAGLLATGRRKVEFGTAEMTLRF